jgi:hypothetical protein
MPGMRSGYSDSTAGSCNTATSEDISGWSYSGGENLVLRPDGLILRAELAPSVGLAIKPGQIVQVTGNLDFVSKDQPLLFLPLSSEKTILTLSPKYRPPYQEFGKVIMQNLKWEFVGS